MSEVSDILDFIQGLTKVGSSMATAQLNFAQARSAEKHKEKLIENARVHQAEQDLLDLNVAELKTQRTNSITTIKGLIDKGYEYGTSLNEWAAIDESLQTVEMKGLMDDYGLSINKDLSISTGEYTSQNEGLNSMQAAQKMRSIMINNLTEKIDDFQDLEDTYQHLGTEEGVKGIIDTPDILNYIQGAKEETLREGLEERYIPSFLKSEEEKNTIGGQASMIASTINFFEKPWMEEAMLSDKYLEGAQDFQSDKISLESSHLALIEKQLKVAGLEAANLFPGPSKTSGLGEPVEVQKEMNKIAAAAVIQHNENILDLDSVYAVKGEGREWKIMQEFYKAIDGKVGDNTTALTTLKNPDAALGYRNQLSIKIIKAFQHGIDNAGGKPGKRLIPLPFGYSLGPVMNPIPKYIAKLVKTASENLGNEKIVNAAVYKLHAYYMPHKKQSGGSVVTLSGEDKVGFRSDKMEQLPYLEGIVDDLGLYGEKGIKYSGRHFINPKTYKDSKIDLDMSWLFQGQDFEDIGAPHKYLNLMMKQWKLVNESYGAAGDERFQHAILETLYNDPKVTRKIKKDGKWVLYGSKTTKSKKKTKGKSKKKTKGKKVVKARTAFSKKVEFAKSKGQTSFRHEGIIYEIGPEGNVFSRAKNEEELAKLSQSIKNQ